MPSRYAMKPCHLLNFCVVSINGNVDFTCPCNWDKCWGKNLNEFSSKQRQVLYFFLF